MLTVTAVGGVATAMTMNTASATPVKQEISFGNRNDPPQGAINATNPRNVSEETIAKFPRSKPEIMLE